MSEKMKIRIKWHDFSFNTKFLIFYVLIYALYILLALIILPSPCNMFVVAFFLILLTIKSTGAFITMNIDQMRKEIKQEEKRGKE